MPREPEWPARPLRHGNSEAFAPNEPEILVVGRSKSSAYIWIGNGAEGDGHCFGTITLRRMKSLLEEAGLNG